MGPGRAGGLLFVAVLLFVLYLVAVTLQGAARLLLGAALAAGILVLAADVARRR